MEEIGEKKTDLLDKAKGSFNWAPSWLDLYGSKGLFKFFIAINLILISISSLVYTDALVDKLEEREIKQVEIYAEALHLALSSTTDIDLTPILNMIQDANEFYEIPAVYMDDNGNVLDYNNLDLPKNISEESKKNLILSKIEEMKEEHDPIEVQIGDGHLGHIYYANSFLLTQLRFYPYIQLSGIFIIVFLAYLAFSSARISEQNRVWVGLAKETAHQLGTPLSSLMAWIDYFRSDENFDQDIANELEKDVQRLEMIATRFSNIGSVPVLKEEEISKIVKDFIEYLQRRVSTKVKFYINDKLPLGQKAMLNRNLFEWVVENICKNSVDAMAGTGEIHITMQLAHQGDEVVMDIRDTGKGIAWSNIQKVFNPGFSTKKRGWGLGLTLSKRIIENYHNGKLFVKLSEVGEGTTFRIVVMTSGKKG